MYILNICSKQWIWRISSCLSELIIENSYLNIYLKQLFCQMYCFNFFSSQSIFCQAYQFFSVNKIIVKLLKKFKKRKAHNKISKELMPIAWHTKRWWNFCMLNMRKNIVTILLCNAFNVYSVRLQGHFDTWYSSIFFLFNFWDILS